MKRQLKVSLKAPEPGCPFPWRSCPTQASPSYPDPFHVLSATHNVWSIPSQGTVLPCTLLYACLCHQGHYFLTVWSRGDCLFPLPYIPQVQEAGPMTTPPSHCYFPTQYFLCHFKGDSQEWHLQTQHEMKLLGTGPSQKHWKNKQKLPESTSSEPTKIARDFQHPSKCGVQEKGDLVGCGGARL